MLVFLYINVRNSLFINVSASLLIHLYIYSLISLRMYLPVHSSVSTLASPTSHAYPCISNCFLPTHKRKERRARLSLAPRHPAPLHSVYKFNSIMSSSLQTNRSLAIYSVKIRERGSCKKPWGLYYIKTCLPFSTYHRHLL